MSFLDSLLYSFSNIFSIGPDMYDDNDDCCGGKGPGGTCCKNFSPQAQAQAEEQPLLLPPSPPTSATETTTTTLSCQQKQALYACHCSDDDTATAMIKIISCGRASMITTTRIEQLLGRPACTVTLDQQCQDLLLTLPICIFILTKEAGTLNRLMGWMNEQIMLASGKPLQRLVYGLILLEPQNYDIAVLFEQKLEQLGATSLAPLLIYTNDNSNDDDVGETDDALTTWTSTFTSALSSQTRQSHPHPPQPHHHNHDQHHYSRPVLKATVVDYSPSVVASAGCTNGMVDVEDMGQVARKIKQVKKKQQRANHEVATATTLRGRPRRTIGLEYSHDDPLPLSSSSCASTSSLLRKTAPTTFVSLSSSNATSLDF